jgi:hypothetical protein
VRSRKCEFLDKESLSCRYELEVRARLRLKLTTQIDEENLLLQQLPSNHPAAITAEMGRFSFFGATSDGAASVVPDADLTGRLAIVVGSAGKDAM